MNKARKIIRKKGITEGQLIDGTGFSSPTVHKIMTAEDWPDPKTYADTLAKVARVLGVSIDELYSENNNAPA